MRSRFFAFFSRSIRGRLTLLIAAVLVPSAILVSWLIVQSYRNERLTLERHLIGSARATALLIDALLAERQALLEGLGTSSRLQRGEWASFRDQAAGVIEHPHEWLVVISADGKEVVNTLQPSDAPLPAIEVTEDLRAANSRGAPFISNLVKGQTVDRHFLFTSLPIVQGGQLRYTLHLAMTPKVFEKVLGQGGAAQGWLATIIDRNSTVAVRNRNPQNFIGVRAGPIISAAMARKPEDVIESVTLDGVESITAYTTSPKSGWTIVIASPAQALFVSAERLLMVALTVSLIFGAGAWLVAWWIGRGVVSAVNTLVAGTKRIGSGRTLPEQSTGMAETDFVFRALTDTSAQLAAHEADLLRANETLKTTALTLRGKQERLDAARTAAATGTFVWHVRSGVMESDESLDKLLSFPQPRSVRSLEEFLGVIHPDDKGRVSENLETCARTEEDFVCEFRIIRGDGIPRWWYTRGKAFPGDPSVSATYMAAACVDVTERKQAEIEVAQARDAAVAAARAKDDFLAALSHELRTPLNPVLLVASDAAEDPDFPPAAREAFAIIAKNVELEARLIDDLLDLTRITQGKLSLDLKTVEVHAVLHQAIATVRAELDKKYQTIDLQLSAVEACVRGDPIRLQQVFWNVLKNAAKFTSARGQIAITTRTVDREVEIQIADNGIGMTADEIARSFKPFSQGDHSLNGSAHRFGGLGLGLAISRMLVELHAGTVTAHSLGRGQGTTFTIRIPLAVSLDETASATATKKLNALPSAKPAGIRILLVEDHEATRTAIERLLKRRGYEVYCASTAAEALRLASETKYDLVLSDIGLPDCDGYRLMKELRDRYAVRGVAITGYGMEADIERARTAGFFAHLTKPVDVNKLSAVLAAAHIDPEVK